jgi:hypothetical protein
MMSIGVKAIAAANLTISCLAEKDATSDVPQTCRWYWDRKDGVLHCGCGRDSCPKVFPNIRKGGFLITG